MKRTDLADFLHDSKYIRTVFKSIWILAVLLLPITSFPWLVKLSGASSVAPLSSIFIVILGVFWLIPYLVRGGKLPFETSPFFFFMLVVGISWSISHFLPIVPYKRHTISQNGLHAFIPFLFAVIVYITTAAWLSNSPNQLQFTLKLINISGFVLLVWSLVQIAFIVFANGKYPLEIFQFQAFLSSRRGTTLFRDRITGFAYEPSWFAHQLVILYLPVWLSMSINGISAFSRRIGRLSLENILLVTGVLALFMSFSRIGWLSFILICGSFVIYFNFRIYKKIKTTLHKRYSSQFGTAFGVILSVGILISFIVGYILLIIILVYIGAQFEPRLEKILASDFSETTSLLYLTNLLFFAERAVYWAAGWDVFGKYPFLGVGLGNSGFFFPQTMPAFGYGLTEIRDLFYRYTFLPNTKSLWIRLFAETGVVGVSVFSAWLYLQFCSAQFVRKIGPPVLRSIGWFGIFTLIALFSEGFSLDSFAMPYIWFSMGIVSAAGMVTRKDFSKREKALEFREGDPN